MTGGWSIVAAAAGSAVGMVLGAAAVAKLRDPQATAASFQALELPAPGALAWAVPFAELSVAGLLVVQPRVGAVAATVLLAAFTAVLAGRWRDAATVGRTIRCACFGSSDAEVSGATFARNGLLAVAALFSLAWSTVRSTVGVIDSPGDARASIVLVALCFVAVGALIISMLTMKEQAGAVFRQSPPRPRGSR